MCCRAVIVRCLQIYNQVLAWPPPMPGSSMCLPLGSGVLNVRVPYFSLLPPPQPAVDPAVQVGLSVPQDQPW